MKQFSCAWKFIIFFAFIFFLVTNARAENPVYTVQVGVFENPENASRMIAGLKKQGLPSFYREDRSPEGDLWFRVYTGKFKSLNQAQRTARRLAEKGMIARTHVRTIENRAREMTAPMADLSAVRAPGRDADEEREAAPAAGPVSPDRPVLSPGPPPGKTTAPSLLDQGIGQYQKENYEETIEILTKYRDKEPRASMGAFFLGMAYKQVGDIEKARLHLTDAVNLPPPVKNALVELIDVLYQTGRYEDAKRWIAVAETEGVSPAGVSFLKGMIRVAEGDCPHAAEAFANAKRLDASYAQSVDMQIGICYTNRRSYKMASQHFQSAIKQDPFSDLGSYARRYQDLVEERRFWERPLRLTVSSLGQYDTNMLVQPNYYQPVARQGSDFWNRDAKSLAMMNMARVDFVPILSGPAIFNAAYAFSNRLHEKYSTSYDLMTHAFSAVPGINFGAFSVNIAGNYTHVLKRDPSYIRYSENFSIGPLLRVLLGQNHILELSAAYAGKNYFASLANAELQDPSACGLDSYLNWIWMFREGQGWFNLRYGFNTDHANGINFEGWGHRITANLLLPVWAKLRLQLGGEIYLQPYRYENVLFGNAKRSDQIYSGTAGLYWDINRHLTLIAQYLKTRGNSNIFLYDYDRELFSLGVELKL